MSVHSAYITPELHRPELSRFRDERTSGETGYRQQVVVVVVIVDGALRALQVRRHDRRRCRRRLHRQRGRPLRRRRPGDGAAAQVKHRRRVDGEERAQLVSRLIHVLVDDGSDSAAADDHLLRRRHCHAGRAIHAEVDIDIDVTHLGQR